MSGSNFCVPTDDSIRAIPDRLGALFPIVIVCKPIDKWLNHGISHAYPPFWTDVADVNQCLVLICTINKFGVEQVEKILRNVTKLFGTGTGPPLLIVHTYSYKPSIVVSLKGRSFSSHWGWGVFYKVLAASHTLHSSNFSQYLTERAYSSPISVRYLW
jgi:hypothetical protein